jgi:hypothetical protein
MNIKFTMQIEDKVSSIELKGFLCGFYLERNVKKPYKYRWLFYSMVYEPMFNFRIHLDSITMIEVDGNTIWEGS